jgi:CubicO group peptidase (beta-lactamase class C family)
MKKLVFFILFFPLTTLAQDEKAETKMLIDSFIKAYNSEDYESVFSLFSEEMKKELPLEELNDFLQNLNSGAGKINQNEFIRYEEKIAIYKLTFDQWVSQYSFSINDNKEINNVFYFVPYQEDILSGLAVNSLSKIDKLISEDQAKLIFEKSKYFPNNTQLSLAFINGDKVNFYGIIRKSDSIIYLNNSQHIFEIGSITKVFTANLLAKAVIDNKIKLNEKVNDYLNIKFKNDISISFKSLANHTSGLPRMPTNFEVEKLDSANVVKVRHILIPYKGAISSAEDVVNTRPTAKKIADSIFDEIKSNNVKFESQLNFSSDTEFSNEFGEIEFTFFDGYAPEFRDFSFDNEVGSIDVIETIFGYHIIEILAKSEKKKLVNLRNLPDNPYKYYDNYDLEDYLKNFLEIDEKTVGNSSYSNLGFGLLGYTIGRIYGMSYEDLLEQVIFSKYEMKNSFLNADLTDKRLVNGLDEKGRVTANWDLSAMESAGGILSNAEDLAKYGIAHFDESNIELKLLTKKTVKVDKQIDTGIGWHIINSTKSNNKWHWHNGGTSNHIGIKIISH